MRTKTEGGVGGGAAGKGGEKRGRREGEDWQGEKCLLWKTHERGMRRAWM